MADDSLEILEEHAFNPTDPAHGLRNYDIGSLKPTQQRTLNKMKMIQRVENENYLKAHPEIKGLISILLRYILREQPFSNVHESAGSFFTRPVHKITADLMEYLADNRYSGPVIDTLYQEITRLDKTSSHTHENDVIHQKSSTNSSKTYSGSMAAVHIEEPEVCKERIIQLRNSH